MSWFLTRLTRRAGMTTAQWMRLPAQQLPVNALVPTQQVHGEIWPQRRPMPTACADECVHVVKVGAVLYVQDGHHRLARARKAHQQFIAGRVFVP